MTLDAVVLRALSEVPPVEPLAPLSAGLAEVERTRRLGDRAADELARRVTEPGPEVCHVRDVEVAPGLDGRLYEPEGTPRGAHLYLHGGSFSMGSSAGVYNDATCRERSVAAGIVVLSLDYRLAPEHVFPLAVEDAYEGLRWLASRYPDMSLSVGGGSAGGNLAAAAGLLARDRGGPSLALALLEVPALDLGCRHLDRTLDASFGDPDGLTEVFATYLGGASAEDPLASPLLARDLDGFPATHIMTAELDPLRGDGEAFLARLRDAGVPCSGGRRAGHLHLTMSFTAIFPPAQAWRAELLEVLRTHHASGRP
jgi:acetyl esterase